MAYILDGKALAERIRNKVKTRIDTLGFQPGLAVILVGDDPASHVYVTIKGEACEEVGIRFEKHLYEASVSEETVLDKIAELNRREDIHGILVQLPLPTQNADRIIAAIDPKKDVDGFHPENVRALKDGKSGIVSAVALGILRLISDALKHATASSAAIVSSDLFAEPLIPLLRERGITSTIIDANDPEAVDTINNADIVIIAIGQPGFLHATMIKPGAIIIDVGTTKIDGKLYGDVDFDSVEPVAGAITPVPGGVGPMTVAMLLANVLKAVHLRCAGYAEPKSHRAESQID